MKQRSDAVVKSRASILRTLPHCTQRVIKLLNKTKIPQLENTTQVSYKFLSLSASLTDFATSEILYNVLVTVGVT